MLLVYTMTQLVDRGRFTW